MCDPVSLTIGAAVLAGGAQIYGGMAANSQGKYEARVSEENRKHEINARNDAAERGVQAQARHWRQVAQMQGEQRAQQAASGLDISFGSAADLLGDVAEIGGQDSMTIARNTETEIKGYEINAANYTMQGRAARAKGKAALIGGIIGGTSTILGGAAQASKMKAG
jgi:hypothetical protein